MTKIIIIGLLVLAAIALAIWALILKGKSNLLDKREIYLNETRDKLECIRNELTADEKTLDSMLRECRSLMNSSVELTASYAVSESDEMKFNTLSAIKKNARKKLTFNLANDIIKKFPEPKYKDGVYGYKFKIMEVE